MNYTVRFHSVFGWWEDEECYFKTFSDAKEYLENARKLDEVKEHFDIITVEDCKTGEILITVRFPVKLPFC